MTERIAVPFEGPGSGIEELSWGQREIWRAMTHQGSWFPIGGARRLPPGATVEDMVERLRFIMSRFQTARTRLRPAVGNHGPWQVVSDAGEATLEIVDAGDEDPAVVAERVRQELRATDFAHGWPVRMTVVRRGTELTHVVTIVCHLVTDAFGWPKMADDVKLRDRRPDTVQPPVTAMQPLDQARWQRSPAGQRQHQNAMRYWEESLRSIPAQRFGASGDPRTPRHAHAGFDSPATLLAVRAISARTRAEPSTVLLALNLVALGRISGVNPVVVRPIVSNRFRPGLADTVSPVNQAGLCVVDVADITFDEAVARTWRSALAAYRNAYFHPDRLAELIERVSRERGEELDLACFVNDRRTKARHDPTAPVPTKADIAEALTRTIFLWFDDRPTRERFFVHIENAPTSFAATVSADTHCVAPADIEAYLRNIEAIAVAAAFDPAVPTGVTRAEALT